MKPITRPWFVIMGARISPDGVPSSAMRRRVEAALAAARAAPGAMFLVTGGAPGGGPPEAQVMRRMLRQAGITDNRIIVEAASRDTLQSVNNCTRLLRTRGDVGSLTICSDDFHLPRCRLLFRLAGLAVAGQASAIDQPRYGRRNRIYFRLREAAALAWDVLLMTAIRLRLRWGR